MSEMIERVARALAKEDGLNPDADPNYVSGSAMTDVAWPSEARLWWRYIRRSRANIAAMREPTKEMLKAGAEGSGEDCEAVADGAWRAMIDAALS